jgi:hypothetical protein
LLASVGLNETPRHRIANFAIWLGILATIYCGGFWK